MEYRMLGGDVGEEGNGYLKVFDYSRMKATYSRRLTASLLSVGVSADGQILAIGMSNGNIFAGRSKMKEPDGSGMIEKGGIFDFRSVPKTRPKLLPGSYRHFHQGQSEKPTEDEHVIAKPKKVKLSEHDKLLKKFRQKKALVSALRTGEPENAVAVMEEVVAGKKILKCIANRDAEEESELIPKFLHKNSKVPRHEGLLMPLGKKVLDTKAEKRSSSDGLKGQMRNQ